MERPKRRHRNSAQRTKLKKETTMNKFFSAMRARHEEAQTRKAMRHLDDHLLRDIGMPPREKHPTIRNF